MNVVVEEAGDEEVRYVGTDIDGRPYGAARVLKRPDFEAVFARERGGWRPWCTSTRCRTAASSTGSSTGSGSRSARRARCRGRSWCSPGGGGPLMATAGIVERVLAGEVRAAAA